jgi:hypothetical protein
MNKRTDDSPKYSRTQYAGADSHIAKSSNGCSGNNEDCKSREAENHSKASIFELVRKNFLAEGYR